MINKIKINLDNKTFMFDFALQLIGKGMSVSRKGWNGKGLRVKQQDPCENSKMTLPYLYIEYPNGDKCPWHASQTDILARDWQEYKEAIIEEEA